MMHVILSEGLEDRAYIAEMTHGFERLAERAREYTPERVAYYTGMTAAEIEQLAREYATTRPAALRLNYGVQRCENGGAAVRAIAMLPALTGAWKHRGGGAQLSTSGAFEWDENALRRPDLALGFAAGPPGAHREHVGAWPRADRARLAALKMGHPCMRCLSTTRILARSHRITTRFAEAWRATICSRLCTISSLPTPPITPISSFRPPRFLNTTTSRAHTGTILCSSQSRPSSRPAKRGQNVWLFGQLAQRMGFTEPCFRDTPEEIIRQALAIGADGHSTNPQMEHITLEDLERDGHIPLAFHADPETRPFRPYASGQVPTPSGKVEFFSEKLAAAGLDPLPGFVPPTESRWGEAAKKFPLELLGRKSDNYMNSTFANLPGHRKMEARTSQKLEIHPQDAQSRGIADGDPVSRLQRSRHDSAHGDAKSEPACRRGGGAAGLGQAAPGRRQLNPSPASG